MERTIARVTTMQSINAKASKMENNKSILYDINCILQSELGDRPEATVGGLLNIILHRLEDTNYETLELIEELTAFLVLAAQKERENASKRPRNQRVS